MKRRRLIPVVAAIAALAVSVPLAWMGSTPFTQACDDVPVYEGGPALSSSTSIWPPGVHCTSPLPSGGEAESTYVAWYELSLALLFSAGVYLVAAAVLGVLAPTKFARGLGVVVLLFLLASGGFFL
jgi:hypothetical protein